MPSEHRDYSGTPLPKKLGVREGARVLVIAAPQGFALEPLPHGVEIVRRVSGTIDVALLFVTRRSELARRLPALVRALATDGRLWIAWPKKAADIDTDLGFETVQRAGLDAGLVDNKSASIDGVFQGLQFVYRLRDRPPKR